MIAYKAFYKFTDGTFGKSIYMHEKSSYLE